MKRILRSRGGALFAMVAAAALLITPLLSSAQSPLSDSNGAPAARGPSDDLVKLQMEAMASQEALRQAEEKALEDATLKQKHDALQSKIEQAMRAEDKSHDSKLERLNTLGEELSKLQMQPEPDTSKLQELWVEAQGIQQQLGATQQKVVQAEPIASEIESMRTLLLAKMTEVDPETPKHIERLESLARQLQ